MNLLTNSPDNHKYFASIALPLVFKDVLETTKNNIILYGGRLGGKSNNTGIIAILAMLQNLDADVVVARVSYGSLGDSSYAELAHAIDSFNNERISETFRLKRSPLRIERVDGRGTCYFLGYGGSNTSRTKSLRPSHKIKIVILEETQELKNKENLDQALASLRRHYAEDVKVFILGNPPNQSLHWFNVFIENCKHDPDWLVRNVTYLDILPFINDHDLKEILKTKILFPDLYEWFYLGIPRAQLGCVYPMFKPELHMVKYDAKETSRILKDFRISAVIIGADGAVTHDATALVPMFIMSNGQAVAGKIFYHNPQTDGVKGSFPLVENEVSRWFKELLTENNLDNRNDYMNSIPIAFVVDSAATELYQALNYFFGNRATVYSVKKGTILQMVDTVQSAIGKNIVGIYDYGGYYNYTVNRWIQGENLLAYQLQTLSWNEKQNGYDDEIPNDVSDAFTYAVYWWFKQTENIVWLDEISKVRQDYYLLNS